MMARFTTTCTLVLLTFLFFISTPSWAQEIAAVNQPANQAILKKAIELKQAGNINQAIKLLQKHLQNNPNDLHARVELAANYFLAKDYARGGKLFKKILAKSHTPEKIKKNIIRFINQHKTQINQQASLNKQLASIKGSQQITAIKINHTQALIQENTSFKKAQLYLAALYLKQYRGNEAKQILNGITYTQLTPSEEASYSKLEHYYEKNFQARSKVSVIGSFIIGHDDNITASGSDGLDEEEFSEDVFDEEGFDEEGFDEEGFDEEGFDEEGFDEEGFDEEGFDEEGFDEEGFDEDGFDEDGFDEDGFNEEGFNEEEFDEDNPDESNECNGCDEDNGDSEKSGLFSRINASVKLINSYPVLTDGILTHHIETAVHASVTERQYQDDDAQHRNYRVLELGANIARRSNQKSRLSLPIAVKNIQLDGEDYARFYDGKVTYGFNTNSSRFTLGQKISYRDYQRFNEERNNALLLKSSFSFIHPLSTSFSLNGQLAFSLLDTENELNRSYDRYKTGLGLKYKVNKDLSFDIGSKYQKTDYKGPFSVEACSDDLCGGTDVDDGIIRQDDLTSLYLHSRLKINDNWSVKARISNAKRNSNVDRYDYTRTTFSAGIYVKF